MSTRNAANGILCPNPETLKKLLDDRLAATEVESVEEHVGICPGCQQVLERMVGSLPDPLALHGPAGDEDPPAFPGYEPLERIDAGGMGVVWRVRDIQFGRDLAVKVIASWGCTSPRLIERFLAEARICAQLTHPFIVPVHTMNRLADGRPYYTMKLVEGRTLAALLQSRPAAAERRMEFVQIFDKVCQAVAFAHGRRVIHRDLKPENVMVGAHGEVQLMDWGLAKVLADEDPGIHCGDGSNATVVEPEDADGVRTSVGSVLGTAAYMAPEQAQGRIEEIDRQTDVFGLGGILCSILTGEPPYTGANAEAVRKRAADADLEETLARLRGCGADPELIGLAERCLAPCKADRPADANTVAAWLSAYQAGVQERLRQAELERAAAQAAAAVERTARRRTRVLATVVLALVALAAGGGLWMQHLAAERRAERARQEGILREEVAAAIGRAIRLRGANHFDLSRQLLEQVRQRLADGGPDDLRTQVEQCLADTVLVGRLDDARQRAFAWVGGQYDLAGAEKEFAAALAEAGLGREGEAPNEVGARVQACAVRAEVVGALDDWAGRTRDDARRAWLLAVARAADPDPERDRLRQPDLWSDRESLTRLVQQSADVPLSPQLVSALAEALRRSDGDAVPLLRAALARHPDDYWLNMALGLALFEAKQWIESVGYQRAALALRPQSIAAYNNLANSLSNLGPTEKAEAIDRYKEALRLDPKFAVGHNNLAQILKARGQVEEAFGHYKEAVLHDPENALFHFNLAVNLKARGRVEEAIDHYKKALSLNSNFADAHYNLANYLLRERGRVEEAIGRYKEALRLDPKHKSAHIGLGNALETRGQEEEAIGHFKEALRLDPEYAEGHCCLGLALRNQGRFAEALASLKRGHELASKRPDWNQPSARWVQKTERLLTLDRKLAAILRGEAQSADAAELLDLAEVGRLKTQYAAAARLAIDAFAAEPKRASVPNAQDRYNAACCAALAAAGRGEDAAKLDSKERCRWRKQALDWLRADLIAYGKLVDGGKEKDRTLVRQRLQHWKHDADLSGVRDKDAVAKLPTDERQACEKLWADAAALLKQAGQKK